MQSEQFQRCHFYGDLAPRDIEIGTRLDTIVQFVAVKVK